MRDQCVLVMLIMWLLIGAGLGGKGALENFMMEADHQKETKPEIRGLVLSAPLPNLWQGEGAEKWVHLWASNIIHCTYVMKTQIKNLNTRAWWSFLVNEHIEVPGEWSTSKSTARTSCPGDSSKPCSMYLPGNLFVYANAMSLQSCSTLCDPIDGSPTGSPVPGTLQARTLEWVAISFSNAWKWKVKVKSPSHVQLLATPWTAAHQGPLSMGFSRQEYWSGVPLPSPQT